MRAEEASVLDRDRKAEHIELGVQRKMQLEARFFDAVAFEHVALPEMDLAEVDTATSFLGKPLAAPLLISSMTGGTDSAARINRNLAIAAEACGVALGVGSQRKALENPELVPTFTVRSQAPTIPLLANLGAVQLNYGYGLEQCEAAVAMIDADALILHLNPLQEAIQPEGDGNFAGLLDKIAAVARGLRVPIIAKEVGSGISASVGRRLAAAGVRIIDAAGLGGTSWARIEAHRAGDPSLGEIFADWGVPSPRCIRELAAIDGVTVIGSGGVRHGVDVAKSIAMGADLVGLAYPFLQAALESPEKVIARIERAVQELRICMFCAGARTIQDLKETPLHEKETR
jgi:isopentenyl-diphosphate delta-isomerase